MIIEVPKNCPCCDFKLELVNDQLFCRNNACSAQLYKKLEHFCKVLGIKGVGPKTIEKLNLSDITEIFYLDAAELEESLGSSKIAEKLLLEIEKAKAAQLSTVLAAFSIPLVGETASAKLAAHVYSIDQITPEICKIAGLGEKVTSNLLNWLETEYPDMREFLPFSFKPGYKPNSNTDTVCITGKLTSVKTKAEGTKLLEQAGYTVVESVTKNLKYLIDEQDNNSSKRKKAEEYGITIVNNLNTFLKEKNK